MLYNREVAFIAALSSLSLGTSFSPGIKISVRYPTLCLSNRDLQQEDAIAPDLEYEIKNNDHPLAPPLPLQNLPLHGTIRPFESMPELSIKRISKNPHIFLLENFLTSREDLGFLMEEAELQGMDYSGTSAGDNVKQRSGSYTGWIYQANGEDEIERNIASEISAHMTDLSCALFIPDHLKGAPSPHLSANMFADVEPLQIVRYEPGGKYDVHHDGYDRFLTCLTYCNGVAGTWFPYAILEGDSKVSDDFDDIPDMTSGNVAHDKTPGKDGILVVGMHDQNYASGKNVVRVLPGDAIVFYNYDWIENYRLDSDDEIPKTGPFINWRSIHSGLTVSEEKWIATNWFRFIAE